MSADDAIKQLQLFGVAGPPLELRSAKERVKWVLQEHPEARDCYRTAQFYVWLYWYNLRDNLGSVEQFRKWYTSEKTVAAKTILQRCQEVQKQNPELRPRPSIQKRRQQQSRQGPVGSR